MLLVGGARAAKRHVFEVLAVVPQANSRQETRRVTLLVGALVVVPTRQDARVLYLLQEVRLALDEDVEHAGAQHLTLFVRSIGCEREFVGLRWKRRSQNRNNPESSLG